MPSQFEQAAATNFSSLYGTFGLPATYIAPDGTASSTGLDGSPLTVRVHREQVRQVDRESRASGELQVGEVMVMQSQLAKPVRGGRFHVEGVEVWTIEATPILKNGEHICNCTRSGVERLMDKRAKE